MTNTDNTYLIRIITYWLNSDIDLLLRGNITEFDLIRCWYHYQNSEVKKFNLYYEIRISFSDTGVFFLISDIEYQLNSPILKESCIVMLRKRIQRVMICQSLSQ